MTMIDIDIFRKIQSSDYYTTYEFWNTDSLKTLCLFFQGKINFIQFILKLLGWLNTSLSTAFSKSIPVII